MAKVMRGLTMAESVENAPFSTRLKSALKNYAGLPVNGINNLDDAIRRYQRDSHAFQAEFLRIPGAGRVSLDEFIAYADKLDGDGDLTGRTVVVAFEEASHLQDEVAQACNSIDSRSTTYRALRRLQALLDAATVHLEQGDDERAMFRRKDA